MHACVCVCVCCKCVYLCKYIYVCVLWIYLGVSEHLCPICVRVSVCSVYACQSDIHVLCVCV